MYYHLIEPIGKESCKYNQYQKEIVVMITEENET
jgi:hypothetical protein